MTQGAHTLSSRSLWDRRAWSPPKLCFLLPSTMQQKTWKPGPEPFRVLGRSSKSQAMHQTLSGNVTWVEEWATLEATRGVEGSGRRSDGTSQWRATECWVLRRENRQLLRSEREGRIWGGRKNGREEASREDGRKVKLYTQLRSRVSSRHC